MVERHPKAILRKVNIVGWKSEAARQAERDFAVNAIPHVLVFDVEGRYVANLRGPRVQEVEAAVRKALGD